MPAKATISSEYDVQAKISQVQQLANYNYDQLVNKTDLIGYRRANFNMYIAQYKTTANMTTEQLRTITSQIQVLNNTSEMSDSDKRMQKNNLFMDADKILYNLDNQTVNFLASCKSTMPTITYQKFVKHFLEYYNSLQITNNTLSFK
jgi:hypothetical protein